MGGDIVYTEAEIALAANGKPFHRSSATAAGLTKHQILHRVQTGSWIEVLPRVYRHAASAETPELMREAALLWAGPDAALSHTSGGVLWALDRVEEEKPEILVSKGNPRSDLVVVHRDPRVRGDEVTTLNGVRCTTVARTIADLAAILDDESLEAAIESARRRHGTELGAIRAAQRCGHGNAGAARLRTILDALDGTTACESVLEVKVARLLRAARLPKPQRQHWVTIFGRRYRLDFVWPELRVALECDGRAFHEFQRDRTRLRHLGASGWTVLPVTWDDVTRRWPAVEAELREALTGVR